MAEDLSKLSSEDIRRFEKAVSETKALTARQEEIAKSVLAAEKEIGKVRLASLNEYFDTYSKGLDEIIARKTSQLNDAFLIMEQKALESFKKTSDKTKQVTPVSKQPESSDSKQQRPTQKRSKASSGQKPTSAVNDSNNVSETDIQEQPASNKQSTSRVSKKTKRNASTGSGSGGGKKPPSTGSSTGTKKPDDNSEENYQVNENASELPDVDRVSAEGIVEKLKAFNGKTTEEQLNIITNAKKQEEAIVKLTQLEDLRRKNREAANKAYADSEQALHDKLTELSLIRLQAQKDSDEQREYQSAKIKDIQIANIQEVTEAEINAQRLINDIEAERVYYTKNADEYGELRERKARTDGIQKSTGQQQKAKNDFISKEELKAKRKNNGILDIEEAKRIRELADKKFKFDVESLDKLTKKRVEREAYEEAKKRGSQLVNNLNTLTSGSWYERKEAMHNLTHDEAGNIDSGKIASEIGATITIELGKVLHGLSDFAKKLNSTIDEVGSYKSAIDTRLQGSSMQTSEGSYWDQITKDMMSIGAVNPYFKQSDFAANIKSLVDQGITFDLEQRAFLMTIQNKIANTFEVADGTLLKLIRIQQEDTTAGRLGMEAALNAFLNNMYENTEYLKQVADNVRGSLAEMQSLMAGAEAAEVEYQVQKWLGSLYSVGMSDTAVNSISTALGQIAAGQIEGLTNGGAGNLLIMAANEAGLSIADILTEGINSEKTNELMQAVVNYLAEIAESSKGNNVIQQQLADVFGVKASDLRAATNLAAKNSVSAIYGNTIYNSSNSYESMLSYLTTMAGSIGDRTSLSEKMTNIWENVQYSMASSMANNPVTYLLYKVASVLDDTTGGIAIPAISVFGNMVDLHTTVADLMRVGAMAGGVIGSFGDLISGLNNSFSGQAMLNQLGISSGSGIAVTPRGDGSIFIQTGGGSSSSSSSGYVGNASSSDIKNSTMQEAADSKKQLMVEAQEEEEANQINVLNATVLKIYELLDDVAHGNSYFRVKVDNYGLTRTGGSSAQGGVNALGNLSGGSEGTGSSSSGSSLSSGGVNYGGINGSIDLSGWTTVI